MVKPWHSGNKINYQPKVTTLVCIPSRRREIFSYKGAYLFKCHIIKKQIRFKGIMPGKRL